MSFLKKFQQILRFLRMDISHSINTSRVHFTTVTIDLQFVYNSDVMRTPYFCVCESKGANKLHEVDVSLFM